MHKAQYCRLFNIEGVCTYIVKGYPMRKRRCKAQIQQLEKQIYDALKNDHPQSVRHVFYLMTNPRLPEPVDKTDQGYQQVQKRVADMRLRGDFPFEWITDSSRRAHHTPTFAGAGDFLRRYAAVYRADLWEDHSENYVEVWTESRSLASVIQPDCQELAVSLYPSGGFSSHSFIYESARHIKAEGKSAVVVYVGDYDPAGVLIDRKIEEGLRTHLGGNFPLSFERIAINMSQIEQYDLPTKPRKTTERRRLDITETVEAEAMPAHTMRVLVRGKVESYLEPNALRVAKTIENSERERLLSLADWADNTR